MGQVKQTRVAVLMGGRSSEYGVSLVSGREVVRNLSRDKYKSLPLVISRDGLSWRLVDKEEFLRVASKFNVKRTIKDWVFRRKREIGGLKELKGMCDVVFIAMHGPFGEDGAVQGMLELAGVPYTGSGVLASALGMDKVMFRRVMKEIGVPIPKYVVLQKMGDLVKVGEELGEPPYFVKPKSQGSSIGVAMVKEGKGLRKAVELAFKYSPAVLVDEYVEGVEVTCGLLGNRNPEVLPLVEIVPAGEFFDYESKYEDGGTQEIVPARVSEKVAKQVRSLALEVYSVLSCKGFSRVDFMLRGGKEPVVLEINTIPGLTPMSLFPKAAAAAGISYGQVLDRIVSFAVED